MHVFGITGASGSGKTTLVTALIAIFMHRGLTVSSIKHAHHDLAFDQPGKDSFRHGQAGAAEVVLAANRGFALFSHRAEPVLANLLERLLPVDLVLVEGFKDDAIPKLEVYRPGLGQPPFWPRMKLQAVASDARLPDCPLPVLDLNSPGDIADFIGAALHLHDGSRIKE